MRKERLAPHEIRWLRRTMGLTMAEMGKFLNRNQATVFRWENGHNAPDDGAAATLIMLWEDVQRQLKEQGLDPTRQYRPSEKPAGWGEFVAGLVVGGMLTYLLTQKEKDE